MANADLSIKKSASPSPVGVGQQFMYTITVRNNGPETATTIMAEDTIPSGVSILAITVEQGSYCYSDGNITWNVGTLNPGDNTIMTITAIPLSEGTISNTATVYHNNTDDEDDVPNNNTVTEEVIVNSSADLLIIKESCPSNTFVGRPYNYRITVINNGPSTATNVIVTDSVPTGLTVDSITPSQGTYDYDGNTITCQLDSIELNGRADIVIQITPSQEGTIVNTSDVTSDVIDLNPDNNTSSVTTIVLPAADLVITKEASEEDIVLGHSLSYTLTVKNNGPSPATNVTVTDTLPSDVTVISVTQSQGSYTQSGNIINFALGNLAKDTICTMKIEIRPTNVGMIKNYAYVSATEEDENQCNNTASVCTYVKKIAGTDLSITKSHEPEPAVLCTPVQYMITVTNNGPENATGIILVEQIPSAFEVTSIQTCQGRCCSCGYEKLPPPHNCDSDDKDEWWKKEKYGKCDNECPRSSEIICQLGSLTVGDSAIVQITGIPKMLCNIVNTAIVTANEEELDPTNNQVTDTMTVISASQQIENLVTAINNLVTTDMLDTQYAKILNQHLKGAKMSIEYHSYDEYKKELSDFIDKIRTFMKKDYLSENQGLEWIKKTELLKKYSLCCN